MSTVFAYNISRVYFQRSYAMSQETEPTQSLISTRDLSRYGMDNQRRVEYAVQRHDGKRGVILFNRHERKQVQQYLVAELEQGFEYRRKALAMVLDARLEAIEESCKHVMEIGKNQLSGQRGQIYAQELLRLRTRLDEMAEAFAIKIDQRLAQLDRYRNDAIRLRERQRLEKSVVDFLDVLDRLADEFSARLEISLPR